MRGLLLAAPPPAPLLRPPGLSNSGARSPGWGRQLHSSAGLSLGRREQKQKQKPQQKQQQQPPPPLSPLQSRRARAEPSLPGAREKQPCALAPAPGKPRRASPRPCWLLLLLLFFFFFLLRAAPPPSSRHLNSFRADRTPPPLPLPSPPSGAWNCQRFGAKGARALFFFGEGLTKSAERWCWGKRRR